MSKNFTATDGKEGEKKRCWFITGENEEELNFLKILVQDESKRRAISKITAQLERSKTGYVHFHAFLEYKTPANFETIKRMFKTAHIQFVTGAKDIAKVRNYCKKEKGRIEGPWIIDSSRSNTSSQSQKRSIPVELESAKRNKLDECYEKIENGEIKKYRELPRSIQMSSAYRYGCSVIDYYNQPPPVRKVQVLVLYGGSGFGKSTNARICLPDNLQVSLSRGSPAWFDGYEGQDALIIDEFEWGAIPVDTFKRLLSGDLPRLQIKGSSVVARYTKIVITTNADPTRWGTRGYYATVTTRNPDSLESVSRRRWVEEEEDGTGIMKKDESTAIKRRLGLHPQSNPKRNKCINIDTLIDPSEANAMFEKTPKTWTNIQNAICSFFNVPLPENPIRSEEEDEEEEASMENPVVCDLLGVSPSPPPSSCASPDLLALSTEDELEINEKNAEKSRLVLLFTAQYEEQGFPKENCRELALQLMDLVTEEANKAGKSLEWAARKLGLL